MPVFLEKSFGGELFAGLCVYVSMCVGGGVCGVYVYAVCAYGVCVCVCGMCVCIGECVYVHVHERVEILVDTWPGGPVYTINKPRSHGAWGWSGVGGCAGGEVGGWVSLFPTSAPTPHTHHDRPGRSPPSHALCLPCPCHPLSCNHFSTLLDFPPPFPDSRKNWQVAQQPQGRAPESGLQRLFWEGGFSWTSSILKLERMWAGSIS